MNRNIPQLTKLILIIELCVALYMVIVLFKSLYDNYQIDAYVAEFDLRNQEIAAENAQLEAELAYYTSDQYKDKIAKQDFGLVNPGEEVLIIPHSKETGTLDLEAEQLSKRLIYYENLPVYKKWWTLLSG